jgi:hypothetical protein
MARQPARQPSKGVSPTQRATAATARAVRSLDLETKVQEDTFRSAITAQNKRMSRGEYAAVAGAAVNQFIETFEAPDNVYARAALRFSPLLLLAPQRKGRGVEGLIKDPRVIGGAAVAALVVVGDLREKSNKAHDIKIYAPSELRQNSSTTVVADVVDKDGKPLPKEKVTWTAAPPTVATVTEIGPNTATLAALDTAATTNTSAVITATCGDIVGRHFLTVTPN